MSADHTAGYVPPLTGIRAVAALLVLGLHAEQNVPVGLDQVLPFFARGYLGVDLFFVLSGYIITHVYFSSLAAPDGRALQVFLWHRFVRLYPVHVTVLAGLVVMVTLAGNLGIALNRPEQWRWGDLFWQLTLLHAWGVTGVIGWNTPSWSISAEWFAYLLFPLLARALAVVRDGTTAISVALTALAATALLFAIMGWSVNTWTGAPALTRVFGEFLCGAALCRAVVLSKGLSRRGGDLLAAGAFVGFILGASTGLPDFALVAMLTIGVLGVAVSRGPLAALLGSWPLIWLGEISYSIYMVHFPILIAIRRLWERLGFTQWDLAGKTFAFLITIALVIAVAAIMFYLVERPARRQLRDRMGVLAPA